MKKKTIVAILVVLIIVLLIIGGVYFIIQNSFNKWIAEPAPHSITFSEDVNNRTLTVTDFEPSEEEGTVLYWRDVEILSGTATLPSGTIDIGDIITNCTESGELGINFQNTATNIIVLPFGSWDFR